MKCQGRVAENVSSFLETSEVKNESSEALLMSQMKRTLELDTKCRPQKSISLGKVSNSGMDHLIFGTSTTEGRYYMAGRTLIVQLVV